MTFQKKFGVKVQIEFSAAHHIRGYDGECSRPHGHNFKVEVEATTLELNEIGLLSSAQPARRAAKINP